MLLEYNNNMVTYCKLFSQGAAPSRTCPYYNTKAPPIGPAQHCICNRLPVHQWWKTFTQKWRALFSNCTTIQ